MGNVTAKTQTTIYDQVSHLAQSHGDQELKLTSNGTVATKMFGSDSTMGKVTAFFGKLFGYDDGTKVKEKFLQEFQDKLTKQINDSGLTSDQKQELSNSVDSLNLKSFLQQSNNGKPAPKLTAGTLITFAETEAKKIDTSISKYVTPNNSAKTFIFAIKTTPENIEKQKTEWNARIRLLNDALSTKKIDEQDPGYSHLTLSDKANIKKSCGMELTFRESINVSNDPQKYIQDKRTELENRLNALDTTSTSDVPDPMKSQTTAPVSPAQNTTPNREQEIQNLGKLIFDALNATEKSNNGKANAQEVLGTITSWKTRPIINNYPLTIKCLSALNDHESNHKLKHNSIINPIIQKVIDAKSSYKPTFLSGLRKFNETDAINIVRPFLSNPSEERPS